MAFQVVVGDGYDRVTGSGGIGSRHIVDERLDPREIQYLYVFMSRIGMSSDSREKVRRALKTRDVSPADLVRLVEEVVSAVPDNREEIAVSMIKDLVQVSRADNVVFPQERASLELAAKAHFGERAPKVIELAEKTVEYEEALISGDASAGELEAHVKEIDQTYIHQPLAADPRGRRLLRPRPA